MCPSLSVNLSRVFLRIAEGNENDMENNEIVNKPKWTTVEYVKAHSNIDFDCTNAVLELYICSAEETILNLLRRTYENLIETYGCVPAPIRHATLLLTDNSYEHRTPAEATNLYLVGYGIDMMLKPYMVL